MSNAALTLAPDIDLGAPVSATNHGRQLDVPRKSPLVPSVCVQVAVSVCVSRSSVPSRVNPDEDVMLRSAPSSVAVSVGGGASISTSTLCFALTAPSASTSIKTAPFGG